MTKEPEMDRSLPALLSVAAATGLVPQDLQAYVAPALREFKHEIAAELGLIDYAAVDKGGFSSQLNGKVGGRMTKKMISFAEAVLAWDYKNRILDLERQKQEQVPNQEIKILAPDASDHE